MTQQVFEERHKKKSMEVVRTALVQQVVERIIERYGDQGHPKDATHAIHKIVEKYSSQEILFAKAFTFSTRRLREYQISLAKGEPEVSLSKNVLDVLALLYTSELQDDGTCLPRYNEQGTFITWDLLQIQPKNEYPSGTQWYYHYAKVGVDKIFYITKYILEFVSVDQVCLYGIDSNRYQGFVKRLSSKRIKIVLKDEYPRYIFLSMHLDSVQTIIEGMAIYNSNSGAIYANIVLLERIRKELRSPLGELIEYHSPSFYDPQQINQLIRKYLERIEINRIRTAYLHIKDEEFLEKLVPHKNHISRPYQFDLQISTPVRSLLRQTEHHKMSVQEKEQEEQFFNDFKRFVLYIQDMIAELCGWQQERIFVKIASAEYNDLLDRKNVESNTIFPK